MSTKSGRVYFEKIDFKKRMHRFYSLMIQPDLFGGVFLVKQWGGIGDRSCHVDFTHFVDEGDAVAAKEELVELRLKRGYDVIV